MAANTKGPLHQAGGLLFALFLVPLTVFNRLGNSSESPMKFGSHVFSSQSLFMLLMLCSSGTVS